jgi:hypothetical protein
VKVPVTGLFHAAELMYLVGCAERGQYRVSVVVLGNGQLQSRCETCCLFFAGKTLDMSYSKLTFIFSNLKYSIFSNKLLTIFRTKNQMSDRDREFASLASKMVTCISACAIGSTALTTTSIQPYSQRLSFRQSPQRPT